MAEVVGPSARRGRALNALTEMGATGLVTANPSSVTWLTGLAGDIEGGPSAWWLPPVAVVEAGRAIVIVPEEDEAAASACGCEVITYPGYVMNAPVPGEAAERALTPLLGGGIWATEPATLPLVLGAGREWVDATAALSRLRAVKDADELELIRSAIRLCDVGQAVARSGVMNGMPEIELWALVRGAMEEEARARVPLLADLVAGERTSEVGGAPGTRSVSEGEPVLIDLVPRKDGYWGDSCSTFCVGTPSAELVECHQQAREALESAVAMVRPGVAAVDLDETIRSRLGHPHHSGHGIGTLYFERPYVAPESDDVLEEGMVIALEPGRYGEAVGARVEQVVIVTANGCEVISGHSLEL